MRTIIVLAAVAGLSITIPPMAAHAQESAYVGQPVTNANDVEASQGPSDYFTGTSWVRMLSRATEPGQAGTALVTFEPSARSNWHTHPAGQTLYVTSGCGLTQVEGGPVQRICAGDVVYSRPGIKHWHGANATESMSHLAITESLGGSAVTWLEPVTDAQYSRQAD